MKFLVDGPEIPEKLINAHADGRVVFFCGAGVSMGASYPDFPGLVEKLAVRNPVADRTEFNDAVSNEEFDFALSIIQKKLGHNGIKLRRDTAEILSAPPETLDNHKVILRLSKTNENPCRLITTNFDRLFQQASKDLIDIKTDSAPKLPTPKPDKWNSIVHLHGILPDPLSDFELENLVLTSADFGDAYLTNGYCSRFLVELLRNFVVVFIGYSLGDRVMRYLLDAVAYSEKYFDDEQGIVQFNKPYAFVDHKEDDKEKILRSWDLKGVLPVPYFVEKDKGGHQRLYDTLGSWADLAVGGAAAKEALVFEEALKPFVPEETFVQERLLWALSDGDGKLIEKLADVDQKEQTASVSWLPFFADNGFLDHVFSPQGLKTKSLENLRHPSDEDVQNKYLGTVTNGIDLTTLKPSSKHLLKWMLWHLESMDFIDWFLNNGGVPHPEFCRMYQQSQSNGKYPELKEDQKLLWDVLTSDAYISSHTLPLRPFEFHDGVDFTNTITAGNFLSHISPKLSVSPSPYRRLHGENGENPSFLNMFEYKLVLRNHSIDYTLQNIISDPDRQEGLDNYFFELTNLVKQGLDWLALFGKASEQHDPTGYSLSSISDHPQNEIVRNFELVVFLLRHAFDRKLQLDPAAAVEASKQWLNQGFPVFKRLFLYAANECGASLDNLASKTLLENSGFCLWALDTKREMNVYLRERIRHWNKNAIESLCDAILLGPPKELYNPMPEGEWLSLKEQLILQHLTKLQQGNVELPESAFQALANLQAAESYLPPEDQSDEFVFFSGRVRQGGYGEYHERPRDQKFIENSPEERFNNWHSEQHSSSLTELAKSNSESFLQTLEVAKERKFDDVTFWSVGFSALVGAIEGDNNISEKKVDEADKENPASNYPNRVMSILRHLDQGVLLDPRVKNSVSEFWRKTDSTLFERDKYLETWDRVWGIFAENSNPKIQDRDFVFYAINDAAGKMTENLLQYLWPEDAKVGAGLPNALTARISKIVGRSDHKIVDASSLIIASRINPLYTVDPKFTEENVINLLSWPNNTNALAYWTSFLWPARIRPDLFSLIQDDFKEAIAKIGQFEDQSAKMLAELFAAASMETNAISGEVQSEILSTLNTEGLELISNFVRFRISRHKETASSYWVQTLKPWLDVHWPRDADLQTQKTKEDFALTAIHCGNSFPDAVVFMERIGVLGEIPHGDSILYSLENRIGSDDEGAPGTNQLPDLFPNEVCQLLSITRPIRWDYGLLTHILDRLIAADAAISAKPCYNSLRDLSAGR